MSSLRESTTTFERVAFESTLRCHPGDTTAKAVFIDWLMEHGYSPLGARREATRIVREETERRQCERVTEWVSNHEVNRERLLDEISTVVPVPVYTDPMVIILPGGSPPERSQERGSYRSEDGCQWDLYPEHELSIDYAHWVPTPVVIRVGAAWVCRRIGNI